MNPNFFGFPQNQFRPIVPRPFEAIGSSVITSGITYIEFSGLDSFQDSYYEIRYVWNNVGGVNTRLLLYVNGDFTDGDYSTQTFTASSTTLAAARVAFSQIGFSAANTTSCVGVARFWRDNLGFFRTFSKFQREGSTAEVIEIDSGGGTTAISTINTVRVAASNAAGLGAQSHFKLYRLSDMYPMMRL